MQEITPAKTRARGRPQTRCDDDTRNVIIEAADVEFRKTGYAPTSISTIARTAGVSTKTLYRLFPTKADLFSNVISTKISGYLLSLDEDRLNALPLREGLERLLIAYGRLTLSAGTIAMTHLVLSESDRFPEIASVFYEQAILRSSKAMESWLSRQAGLNALRLEDTAMATGMLRGMMTMEPQRAVMLGQRGAISDDEIVRRAQECAGLFLHGCSKYPQTN